MDEFKSLSGRTRIATILLGLYLAADLCFSLSGFYLYRNFEDSPLWLVDLVDGAAVASGVLVFLCFIFVGMWIYRASANAHALSGEMDISPGWAVGWYFVPFANLVKPFQAMRETWMASHYRTGWQGESSPPLLFAWWGLWLATNVISNISFRMGLGEDVGLEQLETIAALDLGAALLNLPLVIILIVIMRRIEAAQLSEPYVETFA